MLLSRRESIATGMALAAFPATGQVPTPPLSFTVDVPVDHDRSAAGTFPLACEWGAAPVTGLRTILLVADGQQFFLRPGGAARLQGQLFGTGFNVLGIVGRSRSDRLARMVTPAGRTDWEAAYRLLNWTQWARDLGLVIDRLRLERSGLGLYGRSGGAHLIHQFLTMRPALHARVFVQAAVNSDLDARWGLGADRFWVEFSTRDADAARSLMGWLTQHPDRRRDLVLILQRQNFFETLDALPAARLKTVRAFMTGDEAAIREMRSRYQIDTLEQMNTTTEGVGSAVRLYEFAAPRSDPRGDLKRLAPDLEAAFYYATPLADPGYRPAVPTTEWERLRNQSAELLQVAGRFDHTCDYRTQIGLSGLTRGSHLLILDDNHVFQRWGAHGRQPAFLQAWFAGGWDAPDFQRELAALGELRWREAA